MLIHHEEEKNFNFLNIKLYSIFYRINALIKPLG